MKVSTRLTESLLSEMPVPESDYPSLGRVLVAGVRSGKIGDADQLLKNVEDAVPEALGKRVQYAPLLHAFASEILRDPGLARKMNIPQSIEAAVRYVEEKYRAQVARFMVWIERYATGQGHYARYQ